jgi:UDP-GlcNAc:undecaprenyl-phosphate/decaprenyl-phosphate GlcNAc-1-phosphate transferase
VGEGLRLLLAFALAAALAQLTVPAAIRVARRTGFYDSPAGYKAHSGPTPYLGGIAVISAALLAFLLLADEAGDHWPLVVATVGLLVVGTVDDRVSLSPWLRVGTEVVAAWLLWSEGLGWSFLDSDAANLALTSLWVIAVVNAFNLMDNLDGAAASVAAVSAGCVVVLATIGDAPALAVLAVALCGALIGFLRFNLARPARIFLGDGGSMAVGFLVAGTLMTAPYGDLSGWSMLIPATLAVGVPAFDTVLVIVSRRRRGAPVLSGATDHTTHRLNAVLKSPRAVSFALAFAQAGLCALAVEATQLGRGAAIAMACFALPLGMATVVAVEDPRWMPLSGDS